jgi:hypothetical protein
MTIAEKSTELGIDLAQIALDNYGVAKCTHDGAFHCDDNGVKVHNGYFRWHDDTLSEASTLTDVETAFKAFIDGQEYNAVDTTNIQYEDIV